MNRLSKLCNLQNMYIKFIQSYDPNLLTKFYIYILPTFPSHTDFVFLQYMKAPCKKTQEINICNAVYQICMAIYIFQV
jgi:hypothetical protein